MHSKNGGVDVVDAHEMRARPGRRDPKVFSFLIATPNNFNKSDKLVYLLVLFAKTEKESLVVGSLPRSTAMQPAAAECRPKSLGRGTKKYEIDQTSTECLSSLDPFFPRCHNDLHT